MIGDPSSLLSSNKGALGPNTFWWSAKPAPLRHPGKICRSLAVLFKGGGTNTQTFRLYTIDSYDLLCWSSKATQETQNVSLFVMSCKRHPQFDDPFSTIPVLEWDAWGSSNHRWNFEAVLHPTSLPAEEQLCQEVRGDRLRSLSIAKHRSKSGLNMWHAMPAFSSFKISPPQASARCSCLRISTIGCNLLSSIKLSTSRWKEHLAKSATSYDFSTHNLAMLMRRHQMQLGDQWLEPWPLTRWCCLYQAWTKSGKHVISQSHLMTFAS